MENIAQTKSCKQCKVSFDITDKDLEFYDKISPIFGGKKYSIPTPNLCPECRQQRRLSFRNERKLYKRKCDITQKAILSTYSPDKNYTVYDQTVWWSDKWDALDYSVVYDHKRGFFDMFQELYTTTPKANLISIGSENCEYTHTSANNKNGYMLFESSHNENCFYGYWLQDGKNVYDTSFSNRCENCFNSSDIDDCKHVFFSFNSKSCRDSYYLKDCIGCENCIGCVGLVNKKYHIFNQGVSKEEYHNFLGKIDERDILRKWNRLKNKSIVKYIYTDNSENFSGDYIYNSKDVVNSFWVHDAENIRWSYNVQFTTKNCQDVDVVGYECNLVYESINTALSAYNNAFCALVWHSTFCFYCTYCFYCDNCFGCVGLRNKQYCILNKQYTKQEYEELVPKIIQQMHIAGEWGEFFPSEISLFGYNETIAQEYFPLTKLQAIEKGFNWSDYEPPFPKVDKIIPANKFLGNIDDIPDDILNWAIECEVTKKPFRIIRQELEFYRKNYLPIPRKHPDQRHKERMQLRNPRKLFDRTCDKCGVNLQSTYSADREETVYCENCYNNEVY